MRNFLTILIIVFAFVSCEDHEPAERIIPEWLKPRLEELENSGECHSCTVQRSTYKDEYYYHLYCSYWSCSHCEVYHYDGVLVEWSQDFPMDKWLENRQQILILWECGDELE